MEKTLKERLSAMRAEQAALETKLTTMRAETAALTEARNTAVTKCVSTITDALKDALSNVEFPDSDVYPLTIVLQQDGFTVAVAKGTGTRATRGGRAVAYQGTTYGSAQALVNHLLSIKVIDKVPVSSYSAVRLLQSKGIVFSTVA